MLYLSLLHYSTFWGASQYLVEYFLNRPKGRFFYAMYSVEMILTRNNLRVIIDTEDP